jgi:hypothetical protein
VNYRLFIVDSADKKKRRFTVVRWLADGCISSFCESEDMSGLAEVSDVFPAESIPETLSILASDPYFMHPGDEIVLIPVC